MPTPDERKALLFIAAVALLGGAVRVVASWRDADRPVPSEDLAALDRQLTASDSAAAAARAKKKEGKGGGRTRRQPREAVVTREPRQASIAPVPPVLPYAASAAPASITVDLDRATAEQVAALPGIGPSLAQRIVRWRDSAGGLGGLDGLDCVSGIGPSLLARVAPHVTFSGSRRPSCATPTGSSARRRARP